MMNELFPIETVTQKSPRLLWMEKNDFHTKYRHDLAKKDVAGWEIPKWEAYKGDYNKAVADTFDEDDEGLDIDTAFSPFLAIGRTEAEAIRNLCDNRRIDYLT